jgi:hypothetical protein
VRDHDQNTASTDCCLCRMGAANSPQTGNNPELSTSPAAFLTCTRCEPEQATNCPSRHLRVTISPPNSFPSSHPRHLSLFPRFSFDPTAVRKAVEEFNSPRPQKFHDLLSAKDVITKLRRNQTGYSSPTAGFSLAYPCASKRQLSTCRPVPVMPLARNTEGKRHASNAPAAW